MFQKTNGPPHHRPVALKRKQPDSDSDAQDHEEHKPIILPPGASLPHGEYEAGRVICAACGGGVSFRDDAGGGGFTLRHWDAHRLTCSAPSPPRTPHPHPSSASHPCSYPPPPPPAYTHAYAPAPAPEPPLKRRRAKRTEEERIEYLRGDPHVAQFEPYRVLCGSCDKWIRLRPNSTYCSIPWDAHRKSCLAKKTCDRNAALAKDPAVRKFDAERLLCGVCHKWLTLPPEDHAQALAAWHAHRAACHTAAAALGDVGYVSRRRNAEQRAATLRADVLIRAVEPNRVFCSLCAKWVQLRQDSSYCAYPWLQHRGKCLARYQRRAQKASEIASLKSAKRPSAAASSHANARARAGASPESEEGASAAAAQGHAHRHPPRAIPAGYAAAAAQWARGPVRGGGGGGGGGGDGEGLDGEGEGEEDADADGEEYAEEEGGTPVRYSAGGWSGGGASANGQGSGRADASANAGSASAILRRAVPASLADLDSPGGRCVSFPPSRRRSSLTSPPFFKFVIPHGSRAFIFASVEYLFRTTYEASDDMSVSALLTYLNAAMPQDKHEDFDTGEVVRAASALAAREKGRLVLEGDMLRLCAS
ncbi:hypothetical protein B0H10DRAFT_2165898 [Mycena sp. CBHHK59/15]|nr:hypothetical protein B0H10DRAFT_2165898 [Mycena sp. CBHHK59/15]